jgi:hypothetical protein
MDYLPPGRVVRVGDGRFPRWVVKDAENRYWAGEGQWSDEPSEALLFCREIEAAKQKNRHCLGGDDADTFTVRVVVTVHPGRWSEKELARFLSRHREFFRGGPPGKEGLLLEIVPDTLRRAKP